MYFYEKKKTEYFHYEGKKKKDLEMQHNLMIEKMACIPTDQGHTQRSCTPPPVPTDGQEASQVREWMTFALIPRAEEE